MSIQDMENDLLNRAFNAVVYDGFIDGLARSVVDIDYRGARYSESMHPILDDTPLKDNVYFINQELIARSSLFRDWQSIARFLYSALRHRLCTIASTTAKNAGS